MIRVPTLSVAARTGCRKISEHGAETHPYVWGESSPTFVLNPQTWQTGLEASVCHSLPKRLYGEAAQRLRQSGPEKVHILETRAPKGALVWLHGKAASPLHHHGKHRSLASCGDFTEAVEPARWALPAPVPLLGKPQAPRHPCGVRVGGSPPRILLFGVFGGRSIHHSPPPSPRVDADAAILLACGAAHEPGGTLVAFPELQRNATKPQPPFHCGPGSGGPRNPLARFFSDKGPCPNQHAPIMSRVGEEIYIISVSQTVAAAGEDVH
ncbi:hypothetical protein GWK47_009750 [Chionoecetes opilio]|uniref:Uncharacterized protein n=1 Tax=Chionoecetes opilio TaxID=41210 RepID=A0A8J4XYF4_CHIOP|nr:hypothetical protein GWK47_009750 [Chionoecetes opilio]